MKILSNNSQLFLLAKTNHDQWYESFYDNESFILIGENIEASEKRINEKLKDLEKKVRLNEQVNLKQVASLGMASELYCDIRKCRQAIDELLGKYSLQVEARG